MFGHYAFADTAFAGSLAAAEDEPPPTPGPTLIAQVTALRCVTFGTAWVRMDRSVDATGFLATRFPPVLVPIVLAPARRPTIFRAVALRPVRFGTPTA